MNTNKIILAVLLLFGITTFVHAQLPGTIGTLPPGKSITITYKVSVNADTPVGTTEVCEQGTVSGANFADVLTDDPDLGGNADPPQLLKRRHDDERHVYGIIVDEKTMRPFPVATQSLAVVSYEDQDGVFVQPVFFEPS